MGSKQGEQYFILNKDSFIDVQQTGHIEISKF
jgi:hypothetical protein